MISVRRARLTDLPFVRRLTLESVAFGIPEGRDASNLEVIQKALPHLKDLEALIYRKKDAAFLVAVDEEQEGRPVGFLILEFNHIEDSTGDPQSYIANLAVEPEYWGRYVGNQLVREAAKVTGQRGLRYMVGKISASNRRTVVQALRLGFEIERFQVTMACTPEGVAKMPGRPPEERAHALSRVPGYRGKRAKNQTTAKQESGESK